jgi:hypothetical protein
VSVPRLEEEFTTLKGEPYRLHEEEAILLTSLKKTDGE